MRPDLGPTAPSAPVASRFAAAGAARRWLGELIVETPLILGVIVLCLIFYSQSHEFLAGGNLRVIALESAALAICAVSAGLLVLCGYVDLSVGSVLGMTGVLAGYLMKEHHWDPVLAGAAAIAAGTFVGALNGYLSLYLGFSSIIVTLGMLTLIRGATFLITPAAVFGFPASFATLGNGTVAGVPIPVVIALVVFAAGGFFLAAMPGGRHVYAIGVNPEAAYLSGIPIRRVPFILFALSGASAALAGLIIASRLDSAPTSSLGVGFELTVLTAVLLGGVAFNGGRGSLLGVFAGVLFLGVLQNGLALLNVPFAWQSVTAGGALILSVGLDALTTRLGLRRRVQ